MQNASKRKRANSESIDYFEQAENSAGKSFKNPKKAPGNAEKKEKNALVDPADVIHEVVEEEYNVAPYNVEPEPLKTNPIIEIKPFPKFAKTVSISSKLNVTQSFPDKKLYRRSKNLTN